MALKLDEKDKNAGLTACAAIPDIAKRMPWRLPARVATATSRREVRSLRHLGFSLEEVRGCLDRPDVALHRVIGLHVARLKEQIALQRTLCERLEAIGAWLSSAEEVSVEESIHTMEVMSIVEKYHTPEQLAEIKERGRRLGEERIRQVEAEWAALIAQVRAEIEQGTDPANERVQALATRWMALVEEFTGGSPEIEQALRTMYEQEAMVRERAGLDPPMFAHIGKAMAAAAQGRGLTAPRRIRSSRRR